MFCEVFDTTFWLSAENHVVLPQTTDESGLRNRTWFDPYCSA